MKKLLSAFLAFFMLFTITGCTSDPKSQVEQVCEDYLSALHDGDIKKADTFADNDTKEIQFTNIQKQLEEICQSEDYDKQVTDAVTSSFENIVKNCFLSYKIESVKISDDKTEADVSIKCKGISMYEVDSIIEDSFISSDFKENFANAIQSDLDAYLKTHDKKEALDWYYANFAKAIEDGINDGIKKAKEKQGDTENPYVLHLKNIDGTWKITRL